MIRPITCFCMLLAGASGLGLYQSKHQAQLLDREIVRTIRATTQTRERIKVLQGEWALLNEPGRLAELSEQHLATLRTLSPQQFVPIAELASRLPVPASPGAPAPGSPEAVEEAPATAAEPSSPPRQTPPVIRSQPIQVAARAPAREAPLRQIAAKPAPEPAWQPVTGGSRPAAPPVSRPAMAPIVSAYATPMTAPAAGRAPLVQRVAAPAVGPSYAPRPSPVPWVPYVGSSLGGSRPTLAAPVPVAR